MSPVKIVQDSAAYVAILYSLKFCPFTKWI